MSYQLSNGRYNYLKCRTTKISEDKCSNKSSVRLDYLEKVILDEINNLLNQFYNPSLIKINTHNEIKHQKETLKSELYELSLLKSKKESHLSKVYEDKLNEIITEQQFIMFSKKISDEISDIQKRIEFLDNKINSINEDTSQELNRNKILKKYRNISYLDTVIVNEFIDSIYVGKPNTIGKRKIKINWKI